MPRFTDLTSPQIGELAQQNALVLIPVGQVEEHGRHLPTGTDLFIAEAVVQRVAEQLEGEIPTLVLPALWAGYSGSELLRWPGTIRIGTRVIMDLARDLLTSLIESGFKKIVLVNAHGHHPALLQTAVREVADETDVYAAVLEIASLAREAFQQVRKSPPGGAIHGGEFETSLMLYLGYDLDMNQATDEDHFRQDTPLSPGDGFAGGKPGFWSTWGIQRSRTGIYGSPSYATRETGEVVFQAMIQKAVEFLREYHRHEREEAP